MRISFSFLVFTEQPTRHGPASGALVSLSNTSQVESARRWRGHSSGRVPRAALGRREGRPPRALGRRDNNRRGARVRAQRRHNQADLSRRSWRSLCGPSRSGDWLDARHQPGPSLAQRRHSVWARGRRLSARPGRGPSVGDESFTVVGNFALLQTGPDSGISLAAAVAQRDAQTR